MFIAVIMEARGDEVADGQHNNLSSNASSSETRQERSNGNYIFKDAPICELLIDMFTFPPCVTSAII